MFSHDSIVEVTKPNYAGDLVNPKDAFANLSVIDALTALRVFCWARLEQLAPNPGCDRLARGVTKMETTTPGMARLYFLLWKRYEWVGLFAKKLGSVTESQLPAGFGPANKKAFNAINHLLRVIDEGNWPPVVGVFGELVGLVGTVLLPNLAEPGKAAGDSETKGAGKIPNQGGRPRIGLSSDAFADALKEDRGCEHWNQAQWATYFECSHQTIGRSAGYKGIQKMRTKESRSVVQADGEDESALTEDN